MPAVSARQVAEELLKILVQRAGWMAPDQPWEFPAELHRLYAERALTVLERRG